MSVLNPPFSSAGAIADRADERPSWWDVLHVSFVAIYVSIAGVFWIGQLPAEIIVNTKFGLFAAIVAMSLMSGRSYTRTQTSLLLWIFICAAAALITSLAIDPFDEAIDAMRNFAEPAFWMIGLMGINPRAYRLLFVLLTIGLAAFMLLSQYPVLAFFEFVPNIGPPAGFITPSGADVDNDSFQSAISVLAGGFNGSRTGWGSTVAQSSLLLVALITMGRRIKTSRLLLSLLVITAAMTSIIVTGARGGSLTLFALGIYALVGRLNLSPSQRTGVIFFAVLGAIFVLAVGFTIALPQDYFRGFGRSDSVFEGINTATTGRLDTYVGAINNFVRSPIYGVGTDDSQIMLASGEFLLPHNMWLRFLSQSGLILVAPLIVVTIKLFRILTARMSALSGAADAVREKLPDTSLVVISGFLLAISEPAVIFGSMNANVPFWISLWILTIPFYVSSDDADSAAMPRAGRVSAAA